MRPVNGGNYLSSIYRARSQTAKRLVTDHRGCDHLTDMSGTIAGFAMLLDAGIGESCEVVPQLDSPVRRSRPVKNEVKVRTRKFSIGALFDAQLGRMGEAEFALGRRGCSGEREGCGNEPQRPHHSIAIPPFTCSVSPVT